MKLPIKKKTNYKKKTKQNPSPKNPKTTTTKQKNKLNKRKNQNHTRNKKKKETNNFNNHISLFKGSFQPHFLMNRTLFLFAVCEALTQLGYLYAYPSGLSQKVFTLSKAE